MTTYSVLFILVHCGCSDLFPFYPFIYLTLVVLILFSCFAALLGVDVKKNVIVTVSSDKGLCGGINSTSVKISRALHKLTSGIPCGKLYFW